MPDNILKVEGGKVTLTLSGKAEVLKVANKAEILTVYRGETPADNSSDDSYSESVTNADLIGSIAIISHNLKTENLDVTIRNSFGVVGLNWVPIDINSIRIEFEGLTPLTETFQIFIER